MKKVLVIVGPTGVGKTSLGIFLAKRYRTGIISGDSIQVYKGLNIGSGKVTEEEMQSVPHYLLDIQNPNVPYSSKDFQLAARSFIDQMDFPMIVGGTGLYLKACLYDYTFEEEHAWNAEKYAGMSKEELYRELLKADPQQAKKIHPNNVRRVLRALEIYESTGTRMSETIAKQNHEPLYDCYLVGCTMEREQLYARINARVDQMFEDGLLEEVRGLLHEGYTFSDPGMRGIGYKEFEPYFKAECSLESVKEEIQKHSRNYAKRQYTWLNHQMDVHWYDMNRVNIREEIAADVEAWRKTCTE